MTLRARIVPVEMLRPGDPVRLNEQGHLVVADSDDADIIGRLPGSFRILPNGMIELPSFWPQLDLKVINPEENIMDDQEKQAALQALAVDTATAVLTLVGDLVAGRKCVVIEEVATVRGGSSVRDKRVVIR